MILPGALLFIFFFSKLQRLCSISLQDQFSTSIMQLHLSKNSSLTSVHRQLTVSIKKHCRLLNIIGKTMIKNTKT